MRAAKAGAPQLRPIPLPWSSTTRLGPRGRLLTNEQPPRVSRHPRANQRTAGIRRGAPCVRPPALTCGLLQRAFRELRLLCQSQMNSIPRHSALPQSTPIFRWTVVTLTRGPAGI